MSKSTTRNHAGRTVVHIVTSARTLLILNDHMKAMEAEGVAYHVIANFKNTDHVPDGRRLHQVDLHRGMFAASDLKGFMQVRKLLKRLSPDVVIFSTPKAGLIGGLAAWIFAHKSKRIFLVRGYRFPTMTGLKRKLVQTMELLPARFAGQTLGTSPQTADTLRELLPKRYRTRVGVTLNGTANGIDMDVFSPDNPDLAPSDEVRARYGISPDAFVILVVARVCVDKGFEELTAAFERIKAAHPHAVLLVVGDNDAPDPLSPAAQARLDAVAIRAGRIDNKMIPEVFRAADILAYPSRREGFGISAIEAAAMGTPTVASRVGGLQSAVKDGVSGVFHPVGDVDAIESQIKSFIENPDMLARMSQTAKDHVKDHYDRRLYDRFWLNIVRDPKGT